MGRDEHWKNRCGNYRGLAVSHIESAIGGRGSFGSESTLAKALEDPSSTTY